MPRFTPIALALAAPLAGLGCAAASSPRPLIEPVFSYARDGLHPADASRLADAPSVMLAAASTGETRTPEFSLR